MSTSSPPKKKSSKKRKTQTAAMRKAYAAAATKSEPIVSAEINRSSEFEMIGIDRLHDHPANPKERTKPGAIAELVASIKRFGQREVCRVRPVTSIEDPKARPKLGYQLLSGHRRKAACKSAGKKGVRCEVVDCNDAEALREVLLGNFDRKDLDPIQRAELLQEMIDHGIDRSEAGAAFGLTSESGIKNALRLFDLPKSIRDLVAEGLLPARAARYIIPIAKATMILDRWAKQLRKDSGLRLEAAENPTSVFKVDYSGIYHPDARPVDGKTKYNPGWQHNDTARKFELTDDVRKKLQVVELPIGPKGKMIEVAQDVKLFDKLNKPHLVKRTPYGAKKKAKKKVSSKQTPAQLAAEQKRKRSEADKKLKERLPVWACRFIRMTLASQARPSDPIMAATLPWLVEMTNDREWNVLAAASLGNPTSRQRAMNERESLLHAMLATSGVQNWMTDRLWRILLWPELLDTWPGPKHFEINSDRLGKETPQKIPLTDWRGTINGTTLGKMIDQAKDVSVETAWNAATDLGPERRLLVEFLNLHTSDQLDSLAKKWKVQLLGTSKRDKVTALQLAHAAAKPLPLPDVLAPKKSGKKRGKNQ